MRFLIDRKVTITMLFIALTFLGYVSYNELSMELLPEAEAPTCSVRVSGSGSSFDPSYVEAEVIIPLEGVVAQCSGVQQITSTASTNGGSINVEFKSSVNIKSAYIRLSELITEYSPNLPSDFTVSTSSASSQSSTSGDFMTLRIKGDMDVDDILAITETDLEEKLSNIEGISDVTIYGGRSKSVEVALNSDLCDALGITTQKVSQSLTNAGNERSFVGYSRNGASESSVYVDGGYSSIDMIGNVVVMTSGPVYLKDIASITSSLKEPTSISRLDGERAITVTMSNESGQNIIELAARTRAEIEMLNELFASQGISIVVDSCSADEIEENIAQLGFLGFIGALMAVVILWFFLHNLKLVLSITLAIPISVFAAFNIFYAMDVTINSITLIGITLAVGMLLDNSIVVLENIYRLHSSGRSAEEAVMEGTKQVWRSIFASTLTTITVFLPFVFTSDITIALMGYNLGVAIIATLMFSLAVALLLIPMLTYVILRSGRKSQSIFSGQASIHERPVQIYTILLKSVIRNSTLVLSITLATLFITFIWAASTTDQSMQSVSSDRITISLTMSSDSDVTTNDEIVANFEEKLKDIPELEEMSCTVGEENASIVLKLKDGFDKDKDSRQIGEIVNDVWARIATLRQGLTVNVKSGSSSSSSSSGSRSSGGSSGSGTSSMTMLQALGIGDDENTLLIKGTDYELMTQVGEDIEDILTELDYIGNVSISTQRSSNIVALEIDQYTVNELGISQSALSYALSDLSTEQESGAEIKFGDDEVIDIVITMTDTATLLSGEDADDDVATMKDLYELQVESTNGGFYDMSDIAYIYTTEGESTIQRVDRSRELELTYSFTLQDLTDEIMDSYNAEIDALIAEYPIASGVVIEREESDDTYAEFKFLIFASVLLIFMILASVFESLTLPLVLMFAIPLAAIGSFAALIITDNSLMNLNTLTGFMILLGVVVNGGIILIDYINILRKRGYSRNRAILMSGAMRLRPIMITTITTIVALLPMALGDDDYSGAIGAPFAITVIGGLSFSSLLTLILVPTLYVFLEEAIAWYRGLSRKIYMLHAAIILVVATHVWFNVDDVYAQMAYLVLAIVLTPAITYLIMHSVRIANIKIIDPNEPIVIEARNLVKIYDRAGQFEREWTSAKNRRETLDIDNKYLTVSDLKSLVWQTVIAATLFAGAYIYFESGLWIAIMLIGWAILTIAIWGGLYRYYLNRCGGTPNFFMKILNMLSKSIVALIALSIFALKTENYGVTGIYLGLIILGCIIYSIARMIENKGINVARLTGRFAPLKAIIYNAVLAVPIIGRSRRPFEALKGVSFTIKSGMFGLLGPNGAGKSTFMRIVTGLYEPSYGSIFINGLNTKVHREELQSLIGFLPQEFGTYEYMSAWDFLDYQAILKGVTDSETRKERLEYVLRSVHMYEKRDSLISSFSGGMKQRIGIAMILLNLPRILVVDEPTAGLDPRERIRFRNLLVELSRERVVIFSTHIIEDIASSCNQVAVINRGSLKFFGKPNDMLYFADKKVWSFTVSEEEFMKLDSSLVANNMKNSDGSVKVRYISAQKPVESAVQELESLEDAYLCMLKGL
ncbi:MAG: efflux RND transporter permease subunit [Rikenellaceae bacterium]